MTHTEPATREEQLQRENTTLRAIVAKIMPCHYCGVDDIAKCPAGFPGCDLADDISAYDSLVWTEYRALKQHLTSEPAGPTGIETGWLIEYGAGCYFDGSHFQSDHLQAIRFARAEDAEKFARYRLRDSGHSWKVVEHSWGWGPKPEPAASVPRADLVDCVYEALTKNGVPEHVFKSHNPSGAVADAILALLAASTGARDLRQKRVADWCAAAFGVGQSSSIEQRGLRLLEEATEAYQACGCSPDAAHKLVDYIFAKPADPLARELGGVGITLLALANAAGLSADDEEQRELDRVLAKPLAHFTARNQAKNDAGFIADALIGAKTL